MSVAEDLDVTIATLPPSVINNFMNTDCLKSLRILISSGEACTHQIINAWSSKVKLINGYGPTEGTVCTTLFHVKDNYPATTIGKPVSNVYITLLNSDLSPTPCGGLGEIYIGGANLARGYLNQELMTSQSFIGNTSVLPGIRLYKTGDLARYLPDGNIEYCGRLDRQVKLRGFRVELTEIEAQILQVPGVQKAVVLLNNEANTSSLVAFIVVKNTSMYSNIVEQIRISLSKALPSYMMPNKFIESSDIPLTVSGKIDTQSLLQSISGKSQKTVINSLLHEEQILVDVWKKVLGLKSVNADDNYFELGGDSILSIKVVTLAKEKGLDFSVADIFEFPTIKSLVDNLKTDSNVSKVNQDPFSLISEEDKQRMGL